MKKLLLTLGICICTLGVAMGQISITDASTITIDFTTTVSGVNNGAFLGTGFANSPSAGQLDADAWAITGFSDGDKDFGVESTANDYTRGTPTAGSATGGLGSYDVGSSDPALGFQGTGSDFTPGTITLKITNNSGSIITSLNINYEAWVFNDQARSNSLNFSHSSDNSSYTSESSLDLASTEAADGAPAWVKTDKSISLSGLTVANSADYYIRWSSDDVAGSGSRDEFAIDDIAITPTLEAAGAPTKFVVTEINSGSSPSTDTGFDVVVELQDNNSNPVAATQDTSVTLTVGSGTGALGGTVTGTISSGNNSVTISGVTYNTAESGVSVTATNTGGSLSAGTSSTFEVLAAADQLIISGLATSGTTDIDFDSFTVTAQRSGDSSTDLNYSKSITLSIASGSGNLGGTTSKAASSGVVTFDNISFDAAGDFTIQAADGSLTSSASPSITITDPEPSYLVISGVFDGGVDSQPKGVELFATADIADLSSYGIGAANNGGGTDGQEFTFPADAVSAGDFIYIAASSTGFNTFFGFDANYTDGDLAINGDDAIELFKDGTVRDVFGDINTDGTGESWDYVDGWAYRKNIKTANSTFTSSDWYYSGTGKLDNAVNSSATTPFPTGTYTNGYFSHLFGSAGWRLISTPVTASFDDLLGDFWTQGFTGSDSPSNGVSNVYYYDESVTTGDKNSGFTSVSNQSDNLNQGFGYAVYVYEDDDFTTGGTQGGYPKTITYSGTAPSGNVGPVSFTFNSSGTVADDGWNLAGNPFAAELQVDALGFASESNLDNFVYVYRSGSYTALDASGISTSDSVAVGEGFFVKTTGAVSYTYPIAAAAKSVNFESRDIQFTLKKGNLKSNATLRFHELGEFDKEAFDAYYLQSLEQSHIGFYSIVGEDKLAVNSLPLNPDLEVSIPFEISGTEQGTFTLQWKNPTNFQDSWSLSLYDKVTETTINLLEENEYSFTVEQIIDNRFELIASPGTSVSNEDENSFVKEFKLDQNYPNPFNPSTTIKYAVAENGPVNITVYNVMGQKVAELLNANKGAGNYQVTWNASGVASGIYYYRLTAPGVVLTRQMTLIK
jgi:hypothetical protein